MGVRSHDLSFKRRAHFAATTFHKTVVLFRYLKCGAFENVQYAKTLPREQGQLYLFVRGTTSKESQ